jgi:hypothetical protein
MLAPVVASEVTGKLARPEKMTCAHVAWQCGVVLWASMHACIHTYHNILTDLRELRRRFAFRDWP